MSDSYKKAGVNIESGYLAVERMKKHIKRTIRPEVASEIGDFGALFHLNTQEYKEPMLVSGTDGVGTKILLAQESNRLDSIGIDAVAMCVNDILALGAEPLFFLDYIAVGKNSPEQVEQIVAGVAEGCVQAGAALIGGETAEMPDLYAENEFDIAGFCVGIVEKDKVLQSKNVQAGDVLIGLSSSGIHSNGYSLVRHLFFKENNWSFDEKLANGKTLIDELLTPTKIYVDQVLPLIQDGLIHKIAHITGGGFYENIPRMLPEHLSAEILLSSWEIPEIFNVMKDLGNLSEKELFNVFNMGIGMVLAVSKEDEAEILKRTPNAQVIGHVIDQAGQALVMKK